MRPAWVRATLLAPLAVLPATFLVLLAASLTGGWLFEVESRTDVLQATLMVVPFAVPIALLATIVIGILAARTLWRRGRHSLVDFAAAGALIAAAGFLIGWLYIIIADAYPYSDVWTEARRGAPDAMQWGLLCIVNGAATAALFRIVAFGRPDRLTGRQSALEP